MVLETKCFFVCLFFFFFFFFFFLKIYTTCGHGGHLGHWTATILAIFRSPARRRLHMEFEQHWPGGFTGEVILATLVNLPSTMMYARIQPQVPSVPEKKIFKSFYHIWAWRLSWSMDRNHFTNLLFPLLKVDPYEI